MNYFHNQIVNTLLYIKDKLEERDENLVKRKKYFAEDPLNENEQKQNEDENDDLNNLNIDSNHHLE